jgi:outer membrane protein assembly factor BamB
MKNKKLLITIAILGLSIIISGCVPGPRVEGSPGVAISDDMIYLSSGFFVSAIEAKSLDVEWSYPDKADNRLKFYAQPLVTDKYVYVGSADNAFHKFDIETGEQIWQFDKGKDFFMGIPAEDNGVVFAPCNDGNLYAIDDKGTEIWRLETERFVWAQPQIYGDLIFVASMDSTVHALTKLDGKIVWTYEMAGAVAGSPVVSEDGQRVFVVSIGKEVVALDTMTTDEDKRVVWTFTDDGKMDAVWGNVILIDGILYFGDASGKVYALDAQDGTMVWDKPINVNDPIMGGLAKIEDGFVLVTLSGKIEAYNVDGEKLWSESIELKDDKNNSIPVEVFQAPVVNQDFMVISVVSTTVPAFIMDLSDLTLEPITLEN